MNGWRYIRGTLETRPVPEWDEDLTQDYAVLVYCVDGWIVAAIDERTSPRDRWQAMFDWGEGLLLPVNVSWRSARFGRPSPL